jgi:hypothetical protein
MRAFCFDDIDIADIEFVRDKTDSCYIVVWLKLSLGFVRPLNRVPKMRKEWSEQSKQQIRAHYRPNIGKWFDPFGRSAFYDSREDAARYVVAAALNSPVNCASPRVQAAIRNDIPEVERLLKELIES